MSEIWERCRICGAEWPAGARTECPKYRNADHRRLRKNVRSLDVITFSGGPSSSEAAAPTPPKAPVIPGRPKKVSEPSDA